VPHILQVTGSRAVKDRDAVWAVLDAELAEHPDLVIRVGDCETGLDDFVRDWSWRTWGLLWRTRCRVYERDVARYGWKVAGPKRNEAMIADGASMCRAWFAPVPDGVDPQSMNRGTRNTVKLARRAGIPVVEYGKDTTEQEQETLI